MNTTISSGGVTKVTIIYAVGPTLDHKALAYATVSKQDHLPIEIVSRMGDQVNVSADAIDSLIIALQQIQGMIQRRELKP